MEAVSSSEMLAYSQNTIWQNNPEDHHLYSCSCENLKSHILIFDSVCTDNPLNCDCSLSEFAEWLTNSSQLPASDRTTAVCATPPSLENGLLAEVSPHELLCGEDEEETGPAPPQGPLAPQVPVSGKQVTLHIFQYDGFSVTLLWNVEASAAPYACDALFVYEEVGAHEVLLESNPVRCNSSQLADPRALTLTLSSAGLLLGHRYRYCVVLLEGGGATSDEMALVLGCSDIIPLVPTAQPQSQPLPEFTLTTHIAALHANVSSPGTLLIMVQLWEQPLPDAHCLLTVAVFKSSSPIAQQHLNCSNPKTVIKDLPVGPYRVCATTGDFPSTGPRARCITVQQSISSQDLGGLNIAIATGFVTLSTILLLGLFLATRRLFQRPKLLPTHQCFLAGPQDEEQHSRYVKLHATTKL